MALLELSMDNFTNNYRTVVIHILIAARLTILCQWKKDVAPTLTEVILRVTVHCTYKHSYAIIHGNRDTFKRKWEVWINTYNLTNIF